MFEWYRNAFECYAYLADVKSIHDLEKSKWFTRGWTLQELIAPFSVGGFNFLWDEIGTKRSMKKEISEITGIPPSVLDPIGNIDVKNISVAQIMSWAANRETSRTEDCAYSLLGLFGVNMPMIYGEGNKAFNRLQLEIMKTSDDLSLFAWVDESDIYCRIPDHSQHRLASFPPVVTQNGVTVTRPMSIP